MDVVEEFEAGVHAYEAGYAVEGWDDPEIRQYSPYVAGWFLASIAEVERHRLLNQDGQHVQCPDCGYDIDGFCDDCHDEDDDDE